MNGVTCIITIAVITYHQAFLISLISASNSFFIMILKCEISLPSLPSLSKLPQQIITLSLTTLLIHRERFSKELEQAIHGTVRASPDEWGETLEGEQLRGGSFLEQDQIQVERWWC